MIHLGDNLDYERIKIRNQWQLKRLHSEPTGRLRKNENKENKKCSGMKCVSATFKI